MNIFQNHLALKILVARVEAILKRTKGDSKEPKKIMME